MFNQINMRLLSAVHSMLVHTDVSVRKICKLNFSVSSILISFNHDNIVISQLFAVVKSLGVVTCVDGYEVVQYFSICEPNLVLFMSRLCLGVGDESGTLYGLLVASISKFVFTSCMHSNRLISISNLPKI